MDEQEKWLSTQHHWLRFQEEIRTARATVGVTYAGAWLRGQNHDWRLAPSLFRQLPEQERELVILREKSRTCTQNLKKSQAFLTRNKIEQDDEIAKNLKSELEHIEAEISLAEKAIPTNGRVQGEGRAFIEYRFRSGAHHQSSWQTLAEMQHYGVPTRLLDWTESFVHALAFALGDYASLLADLWLKDRHSQTPPKQLRWHDVQAMVRLEDNILAPAIPTIWVLNPYKLAAAKGSKGKNVLWDMTLNPADDYYKLFIDVDPDIDHRFTLPVPILSPWADERIAAQRGVFTCHGSDHRALNELPLERVVRPVKMTREAAIHGVRFLAEVGALDRFAMFRDRDSLGRKTREEFLTRR